MYRVRSNKHVSPEDKTRSQWFGGVGLYGHTPHARWQMTCSTRERVTSTACTVAGSPYKHAAGADRNNYFLIATTFYLGPTSYSFDRVDVRTHLGQLDASSDNMFHIMLSLLFQLALFAVANASPITTQSDDFLGYHVGGGVFGFIVLVLDIIVWSKSHSPLLCVTRI